jgi:hypothetical protein
VIEGDAASLGFSLDKRKSRPNLPIFSKQITQRWDLCWELEKPMKLTSKPFGWRFHPLLELRHRDLTGPIDGKKAGEFLLLRYHHIIRGFGNAYGAFTDLDELETLIKAHLYHYRLMAPIIETGIEKILGGQAT